MRALYKERMQCGTTLNEKLMYFPSGSFPDLHVELPLQSSPSPAAWQRQVPTVGVSGCGDRDPQCHGHWWGWQLAGGPPEALNPLDGPHCVPSS